MIRLRIATTRPNEHIFENPLYKLFFDHFSTICNEIIVTYEDFVEKQRCENGG